MKARRRNILIAAGAVLVLGGTGAAAALTIDSAGGSSNPSPPAVSTATVTRQTLRQEETVDGKLGYGGSYAVTGSGGGTVTWLPAAGKVIGQGETVYRVNNVPIPLFLGKTPFWRPLAAGMSDGADVRVLEQNLSDLGFFDGGPNKSFTAKTAEALKEWQDSVGMPATGRIDPAAVVVLPDQVRVSSVGVAIGQPAAGKILECSGVKRLVTVDLPVDKQEVAKVGGTVTVTMPDGKTTSGRISSVGTVAKKPDPAGGGEGTGTPTVSVSVDLGAGETVLDQAPVQVAFTAETKENVLTVPVSALLALSEGGYGVEVVTPGGRKVVAVTTGMFSKGKVEISSAEISEGMKVTVAAE